MQESVGQPINRVEGRDKVLGRAKYAADHTIPGLTYAVLVQSEVPHGVLKASELAESIKEVSKAPGVLYVLTPENCPSVKVLPKDLTYDLPLERRPPLSDLTIQHVGQHLALIVADTLENATHAASLIELKCEQLPALLSAEEVVAAPVEPDAKDGQIRHGSYLPDHFVKLTEEKLQDVRGSIVDSAAQTRISQKYETPVHSHYPIELSSTIALWEGDSLTLYDSTRWIVGERKAIASYLDMPEDKVRIISPFVGGAFGSKSFLWMHVVLAAVAARLVGRPVKLVLTRDQMFTSTGHRPRTTQELVLVADHSGLLTSTEHHTITETSTVAHFCEPAGLSSRILYRSPHLAVSHRVARINAPTPCFMRGPGEAPGLFALEVAMDELAYSLHLDPVELRARNHADSDQASGKPWSSKHLLECYQDAMERFHWKERVPAPRTMRRNGLMVGWGMATATYPGRRMPAGCRVVVNKAGVATFSSATHEVGNGVRTVMTQIAMDAVGLPQELIVFSSGDSSFPDAPYSGASQTSATVGSAVFEAAKELERRLIKLAVDDSASPLFKHRAEQIELVDGWLSVPAEPTKREHYLSLIDRISGSTLEGNLSFVVQSDAGDQEKYGFQSFGAHFCEVEVDEEIGSVSVTRWVGSFDCGKILNVKLARNQIMGGITFGLGMALLEQVPYDRKTAQLIGEYYLPTHADRPEFDISFVEFPDYALDPMGARGVGEIGICGVAAAIANAIYHATGKRLRQLPITLEQLMKPF